MKYDSDIHHRRSIRLEGYDYSQARAYFVTLCTQDCKCLFGNVVDGEMCLNEIGRIVNEQWHALPQRFRRLELDAFVVMPNHVHGVFVITVGAAPVGAPLAGALTVGARDDVGRAPARGAPTGDAPLSASSGPPADRAPAGGTSLSALSRAPARGGPTVGDIVGAYKSLCVHHGLAWTKRHAPGCVLGKIWQRNYWEHIIRDESDLNHIREYTQNNPMQWEMDTLHRSGGPCA